MSAEIPVLKGSKPLLTIDHIDVGYVHRHRHQRVLEQVSFEIHSGESVGLIGETGSGKSTVARSILGLVKPSSGTISIDGRMVTGFSQPDWTSFRREGVVQYVFQDPLRSLDADQTIGESIAEPLRIRGALSRSETRQKILSLLSKVNLPEELLNRYPGELSGGQRQRVAIARALITDPRVLILDEPVSALDSANRVQVLEILKGIQAAGVTLVFISHDLGSVAGVTQRTLVLYRGRLVEDRATDQVINDPQHPYTQLLVGSAPSLAGAGIDKARRDELRAALQA